MYKNGNRILFLVDHKHRDLPGLSLIGYFLKQMGHQVKYVALWQEGELIESFDPNYIVLPKPIYEFNRLIRFKLAGRKIVVINTEGNPQDKKFKMNIEVPPDLYFFWNKSQLELDQTSLVDAETVSKVVGCPRMDFYHKRMKNLFPSRKVLLNRYGLFPDNKTITIATSTQDADFDDAAVENMTVHRNRILAETADYSDIANNMRKSRYFLTELIQHIADVYPLLSHIQTKTSRTGASWLILFLAQIFISVLVNQLTICYNSRIYILLLMYVRLHLRVYSQEFL